MWARIENGTVAEITDIDPAGRFHPSLEWIQFDGRTNVAAGWQYDGEQFIEPVGESAETRRARAIARIDTRAGKVRAAYASDGTLVDAEYQQALTAAQSWDAAGRPADDVPDDVQAWADATGNDAGWAADDIISTAEAWSQALSQIRRVRLTGKEAIRAAADDADFDALAQQYIEQFEQIEAGVPEDM